MRILVVDDEDIVLASCRLVLEAENFEVSVLPSARAALKASELDPPDLFLIDIMMPERDGMYLTRAVKQRWPQVPVIVMSGYHTVEKVAQAQACGADCFIAKPFTPDELLDIVRRTLTKEKTPCKK